MKRRVLIIVENLPVPFDRRVWSEATALKQAGYTVSVICPKGKEATRSREQIDGIEIYRHPLLVEARSAKGYPLEYLFALMFQFYLSFRVLFAQGFDVIHACNPPDTIFLIGAFFKYIFGKKFIFDHHDINPELYEAKFGQRDFLYSLLCKLEYWTFKVADVSIATNESYRRIAIERGHMDPQKVFVVRSGPNLSRLKLLPPEPECKNGRDFLVGYVGVIGEQEGIDLLLESFQHIVKNYGRRDVHLTIVGSGPALEDMKILATQIDLGDFVTFTGRVSDDTLLKVLNTADVCVNSDRYNDMNDKSTMNKIMEYMALKKPIVQFDVTEGRYSAQDASLYAEANDAADFAQKILTLIDNPEQRRAMGEFGYKRVRDELAWQYEAPKLLAAYDAAFSDGGQP